MKKIDSQKNEEVSRPKISEDPKAAGMESVAQEQTITTIFERVKKSTSSIPKASFLSRESLKKKVAKASEVIIEHFSEKGILIYKGFISDGEEWTQASYKDIETTAIKTLISAGIDKKDTFIKDEFRKNILPIWIEAMNFKAESIISGDEKASKKLVFPKELPVIAYDKDANRPSNTSDSEDYEGYEGMILYMKEKYPNAKRNIFTEIFDFGKDEELPTIYKNYRLAGGTISMREFSYLLMSDIIPAYDPILDFFNGLPEWDGVDRLTELTKKVTLKNPDDFWFWESMLKKHMVRTIRQAIEREKGTPNRYVLLFQSREEGTGKTTFWRWLQPISKEYTHEGLSKDVREAASQKLFINIEEMDVLKGKDMDSTKQLISDNGYSRTTKFTHNVEFKPRTASFFGSSNNAQFLGEGENTRWLVIQTDKFEFNYTKIDKVQLWAQVMALYKDASFNPELDKKELFRQKEINASFKYKSDELLYIETYFEPSKTRAVCATAVTDFLNLMASKRFSSSRIGRALNEAGFEAIIKNGVKHYRADVISKYGYHKIESVAYPVYKTGGKVKRLGDVSGDNEENNPKTKNSPERGLFDGSEYDISAF